MRKWINLMESTILPAEETKFWYSSRDNNFILHDIDTHHIKIVAQNPEDFKLHPDDVSHHPYADGDLDDSDSGDYDEFDDDSYDDGGEQEWADNNDLGIFNKLYQNGWVRGGHYIDTMLYHDFGEVRPEDTIYLTATDMKAVRRCVRACITKWSWVTSFVIEINDEMITLRDIEDTETFIKTGRGPIG